MDCQKQKQYHRIFSKTDKQTATNAWFFSWFYSEAKPFLSREWWGGGSIKWESGNLFL